MPVSDNRPRPRYTLLARRQPIDSRAQMQPQFSKYKTQSLLRIPNSARDLALNLPPSELRPARGNGGEGEAVSLLSAISQFTFSCSQGALSSWSATRIREGEVGPR